MSRVPPAGVDAIAVRPSMASEEMNGRRRDAILAVIVVLICLLLSILVIKWGCTPDAKPGPTLGGVFKLWGC